MYHLMRSMRVLREDASLGERIRHYRNKRRMIITELAERTGISRSPLLKYEYDQTRPALRDLKKIAAALGIGANELYDDYYRFIDSNFSKRIKQIRIEHDLQQNELGNLLGVTHAQISKLELGTSIPTRKQWECLKELNYI